MEKGARWSAGDEEPEAVAALEGVDGEDLDVDADDGVESLTGSLGHLRSVSLTTIVVMLAHPLSSSSELFFFSKRRRRLRSGTRAPERGATHTHVTCKFCTASAAPLFVFNRNQVDKDNIVRRRAVPAAGQADAWYSTR